VEALFFAEDSISLLIYGFSSRVEVKMPIGSHGCLDGFAILHSKLLKYVLNVLCLANEGSILELLDFCIMILLNSSQVDLLVDPNIISST
jgi:hypothetical protein